MIILPLDGTVAISRSRLAPSVPPRLLCITTTALIHGPVACRQRERRCCRDGYPCRMPQHLRIRQGEITD